MTATENTEKAKIKDVKPTYEQLAKALETEIQYRQELEREVVELRRFANFVRNCKSKQDWGRLRNLVLTTNKKFLGRS